MNRRDVLSALARAGVPDPAAALDVILETIATGLAAGEDVALRNFGRFEPRGRKAVVRKVPGTDKEITVAAQIGVGFIPSQALKRRLNS